MSDALDLPRPDESGVTIDRLILLGAAVALAWWSWGTWPDPIIDWGSELYFAWRIAAGQVLYRDLAYFNGPLSVYFNGLLFALFGAGQHVIWYANLLILAAMILMLYALVRELSGRFAALVCGLAFIAVFAFPHYVVVSNYNYVTPYTQEMTHGLA